MTEAEKFTHARKLNIARRHLTTSQKQKLTDDEIKANPARTNTEIAKAIGVSDKTVASRREKLEACSEIPNIETITDTLGRKQPRKKNRNKQPKQPVSVFNPTKREERAMKNPAVVERMKEDGSS